MGLDKQSLSATWQRQQQGRENQLWPIVINTTGLSLFSPKEVEISPCDSIWMPTTYDVSYGVNPMQQAAIDGGDTTYMPPNNLNGPNGATVPVVGFNPPDIWDASTWAITAPIFALRINSVNNPWLLFGLSTLIAGIGFEGGRYVVGQGGAMRSITTPISRLWVQLYQYATNANVSEVNPGDFSQIVLLSSLGINQQTVETSFMIDSDLDAMTPTVYSIGGGGYVTPQINTKDELILQHRTNRMNGKP